MADFEINTGGGFHSFWWGGFECADHLNAFGNRINMYNLTAHIEKIEEDYANLKALGISTIREGMCWSEAEKTPYRYDFSIAEKIMTTAKAFGIQVIWDICHFGFPDDLTPLHPMFARRFSAVCCAFSEFLTQRFPDEIFYIVPINEVSFVSWLGGDARGTVPYTINSGWDVKYHLMKAYIEGVRKMKENFSHIQVITSEPLIHITTRYPEDAAAVLEANAAHNNQYQMLEILMGNICPELGGSPDLVDIIGVNFYFNNQWINETHEFLPWAEVPPHPLWKNLSDLISEVFLRYGKPVVVTETGHPGEDRVKWLEMIRQETAKILQMGLPLKACCLYPVTDRPDWDHTDQWHHSGIWDIYDETTLARIPQNEVIAKIKSMTGEHSDENATFA